MKLGIKLNLYYFVALLLAFLLGGGLAYYVLDRAVKRGVHRVMKAEEDYLRLKIAQGLSLERINEDPRQKVVALNHLFGISLDKFRIQDSSIYHPESARMYPYRVLHVHRQIEGKVYRISIIRPMVQTEDLIRRTSILLGNVALVVIGVILLFNYFFSKRLLRPFLQTLEKIKKHRLSSATALKLPKTSTKEFSELNQILEEMTDQIRIDYNNLKEFTENTSHEIQTPLTIIRTKLELLLSSEKLDATQLSLLNTAYQATLNLSNLSRTLGLLTKIENQEFNNIEAINLEELLAQLLFSFRELFQLKNIQIVTRFDGSPVVQADPFILNILFTNLLKNSITHNFEDGKIELELQKKAFKIANTGPELHFPAEQIFDRFQSNRSKQSTGLGLAIAKRICDQLSWEIQYDGKGEWHSFIVWFGR